MQIRADDRDRNYRDYDIGIYICDPYSSESEFYIHEFPGFTVNTDTTGITESTGGDDSSLFDTCTACGGSGDCNYCWGRGYHWNDRNQDCAVCSGSGNCYSCGGSGRR